MFTTRLTPNEMSTSENTIVATCAGNPSGWMGITAMKKSVKMPITAEKNTSSRIRGWNCRRKMSACATM